MHLLRREKGELADRVLHSGHGDLTFPQKLGALLRCVGRTLAVLPLMCALGTGRDMYMAQRLLAHLLLPTPLAASAPRSAVQQEWACAAHD